MFHRVLVAVDGSEPSAAAIREALHLLEGAPAPALRLVNVLEIPQSLLAGEGVPFNDVIGELRRAGEQILADARRVAHDGGVEAETAILDATSRSVTDAIIADATAWRAEAIVAGTHGRRGFGRVLLGSVAEGIARASEIPVLLVRQRRPAGGA